MVVSSRAAAQMQVIDALDSCPANDQRSPAGAHDTRSAGRVQRGVSWLQLN